MPESPDEEIALEIAHLLYLDIVGYSKLPSKEQRVAVDALNQCVRASEQFQKAEAADRLIRIPTGDGMALVFYSSPQAPAQCALEVSRVLKNHPRVPVRMGVHSGSVTGVVDVNGRANLAGAGLNIAQRVMDCGDAGHILVSKNAADDLDEYESWQPLLHSLGTCEVKHGVKLQIVNLYDGAIGNPQLPARIRAQRRRLAKKWISLGATALVLAAIALSFSLFPRRAAAANKSIAVLPFKPLLAENRDPVLELGLADTLITKLSNTHEIIVPSLTSVRRFAGADQDPVAAGRQLNVGSVLEGNVVKAGDRLRVTVRLIKIADGSSLWAQTFDESMTDVFAVEDKIAQAVVDALTLRLSGAGQKRLTKRETENVAAYEFYLTGRYHWNKLTPPEIAESIGFFQRAVDLDPNYALAYFGLADAYRALVIASDMPAGELLPKAKMAAERAIQIDNSLAEPHANLALVHMWFDWDWTAAEQEGKRAVTLNPNLGFSHWAYAHVLSNLGRHAEAIAESKRARELDPTSLIANAREGAVLFYAGHNDRARAQLRKTIEPEPNFWIAHLFLGYIDLRERKFPEALADFGKAKEFSRGNSEAISMIGYTLANAGDLAKARATLDQLIALSHQRYIPPCNIAAVYTALGDKEQAFAFLEKACQDHDARLSFLKIDPRWDPLHGDRRYDAILRRIHLQ